MNLSWIPFLLLSTSLSGQIITGAIEKIGQDQLQLKTSTGSVTVLTDSHTKIWKSEVPHAQKKLAVGDEIRVNYYGDLSSKITAVVISASVTLRGLVLDTGTTRLTVRIQHPTKPGSPDCEDKIFVFVHPTTALGAGRKELAAGRYVQIIGWDVGDGVVEASHIAVYNSDVPARLPRKS